MKATHTDRKAIDVLTDASEELIRRGVDEKMRRDILWANEHLTARLAADQQKGGGEVAWDDLPELESTAEFMRQCRLQWERRSAQISGYDNRKARKKAKQRAAHFANAERALSAQQPSIPAPAQQEVISPSVGDWPAEMTVEKAMAAQRYIRDWTPDYVKDYIDSISPAQQDGKASGGEVFAWASPDDIEDFKRSRLHGGRFGLFVGEVPDARCIVPIYLGEVAHPPHADQETKG